jgi:hypothetical protein
MILATIFLKLHFDGCWPTWHTPSLLVVVFCTDKIQGGQYRVFQFQGGLVNYKSHGNLSWFRSLLEGNSTTSNSLILKMNKCYKGWAGSTKSSRGDGGNRARTPCLKGRGPFVGHAVAGLNYTASGAIDWGGQFIEAGQGFPSNLLGSRALRWMMSEMVLGDVASRRRLYLVVKPFHVGINMDGLACSLQCPMICSRQTRGHGFLSGIALSRCTTVGGGAFPGDLKPSGLAIW